jgi:diketogulonate reductase-like aldo/keto reductase
MGIINSTNGTHVNENYAALDWEMEAEDYQKLDELEIVNPWMDEYVKGS